MRVTETFLSIQGETTRAGELCLFIRLTGCDVRCAWCDTAYAFEGGSEMTIDELVGLARNAPARLVCVTGGEPMLQAETPALLQVLVDLGLEVQLMTRGAFPLGSVPARVSRVIDIKTPWCHDIRGPGVPPDRDLPPPHLAPVNLDLLTRRDEVKFVVRTRVEFDWACRFVRLASLLDRAGAVLVGPAWGELDAAQLVEWMKESGLPFRLNLQLHKYLKVR